MHPSDCPPSWKYETHPNHAVLSSRVENLVVALASRDIDTLAVAADTRQAHGMIFAGLTPDGCEYFAGHYRGEKFRCLQFCTVGVGGDPRVGAQPSVVGYLMQELSSEIRVGLTALDANAMLTTEQRLRYLVALASHAFVAFLTIHPFVNGNGHAGRLIVWSVFGRYNHWPKNWPIEPRPADPSYVPLIVEHRNGNLEPFENYLLQTLIA